MSCPNWITFSLEVEPTVSCLSFVLLISLVDINALRQTHISIRAKIICSWDNQGRLSSQNQASTYWKQFRREYIRAYIYHRTYVTDNFVPISGSVTGYKCLSKGNSFSNIIMNCFSFPISKNNVVIKWYYAFVNIYFCMDESVFKQYACNKKIILVNASDIWLRQSANN